MTIFRQTIPTRCTVTVKHTEETLEAHVELDEGLLPDVGDRITVFGDPVRVEYGSSLEVRRDARLVRGSSFDKLWLKIRSMFEMTELYEVSFSPRRF
jgi:hypothetical protein